MTSFLKSNAILWVVLALLAGLATLAVEGTTVTGPYLLTIVLALASGVALLGGIVLGSPVPNGQTFPHLIFVVAVIGLTVAMALEHVWTADQVQYVVGAIIGGGLAGFGSTVTTSSPAPADPTAPAAPAAPAAPVTPAETAPPAPTVIVQAPPAAPVVSVVPSPAPVPPQWGTMDSTPVASTGPAAAVAPPPPAPAGPNPAPPAPGA